MPVATFQTDTLRELTALVKASGPCRQQKRQRHAGKRGIRVE